MKQNKIFGRIIVPVLIMLIFLPYISCIVFYQAAKSYAYNEAENNLEILLEKILPIMENSFLDKDYSEAVGNEDKVKFFLSKVGYIASQIGGNARLMILASKMQVIYPRDEQLRADVALLAAEFSEYIQSSEETFQNKAVKFEVNDGEIYLIKIFKVPVDSVRVKYLIAYCPASQIGLWIKDAVLLVLIISSIFAILIFIVIWTAARSITQPLYRLCSEAERIGAGDFTEIQPYFSLTELENLRLAMNRMSIQLMRYDESQKNFFQNVSHELRNPLMSISGYAQGIEQGVFSNQKEAAHTILEESVRLTNVVNSLLTLSRLEGYSHNLNLKYIKVIDVVEDSLDRVNGTAIQKNISLVLAHFDHNMNMYGDEELVGKVLENLLTNAIRYAKTTVTVSVYEQKNRIHISVLDDGEGIDEKDMPHLFERCYKGKDGNFGIGLAIAHSAAVNMKGELNAFNRETGGAEFVLSLFKNYTE